jgi:hypothetical protein
MLTLGRLPYFGVLCAKPLVFIAGAGEKQYAFQSGPSGLSWVSLLERAKLQHFGQKH